MLSILVLATAAAAGLQYGGIVDFKPATNRLVELAETADILARPPRHVIVGLDVTAGREGELAKDREAIAALVRDMGPGSRCSVFLIHSRSEAEQAAVFSAVMPENEGPAGQLLARAKKKADSDWASCWEHEVIPLITSDKKQRTDLFGFMRFVATQKPEFLESEHPVLVLFTDAQQVGDGFNMERKVPSEAELERAKQLGLVPDLTGARLVFAGMTPTHGISNGHWRRLQTFWKEYAKTAGAKAVSVSSEHNVEVR